MNAASIEKSERLGRVLDLLSQGGEFSTLDIYLFRILYNAHMPRQSRHGSFGETMKHHQHNQYPYSAEFKRRLFTSKRRCESAAGILLAAAIGVGMAALLVAWWSS